MLKIQEFCLSSKPAHTHVCSVYVIIRCWTGMPEPYFMFLCWSCKWQSHLHQLNLPLLFLYVCFIPSGKEAKLKVAFLPILCLLHDCDLCSEQHFQG